MVRQLREIKKNMQTTGMKIQGFIVYIISVTNNKNNTHERCFERSIII